MTTTLGIIAIILAVFNIIQRNSINTMKSIIAKQHKLIEEDFNSSMESFLDELTKQATIVELDKKEK